MPGLVDIGQGLGQPGRADTQGEHLGVVGIVVVQRRLGRFAGAVELGVADHADDDQVAVAADQRTADDLLRRQAQVGHGGGVEHHAVAVVEGGIHVRRALVLQAIGHEVTPGEQGDAIQRTIAGADIGLVQGDDLGLAGQIHRVQRLIGGERNIVGLRHRLDPRIGRQLLAQALAGRDGEGAGVEDHDVVVPKAQLRAAGVVDLAEHHQGGDAQGDRDGELDHDQRAAQQAGAAMAAPAAAQHRGWPEAGQHQGRIDAAEQAGDCRHGDDHRQHRPVGQVAEADRVLQETIERRQQHLDQGQGQDQPQHGHQHRLAQELRHQLRAARAQGLAHPDLLRP